MADQREPDDLEDAYVASLIELDAAFRALQAELAEGAASIARIRRHLERGGTVRELLETGQPQAVRRRIGAGLVQVERARHVRDRVLFRVLQAEGMSAAEIGRTFGLSRALVTRLINEDD
jgi:hypothetical protein